MVPNITMEHTIVFVCGFPLSLNFSRFPLLPYIVTVQTRRRLVNSTKIER